jgi:hypothetical protein
MQPNLPSNWPHDDLKKHIQPEDRQRSKMYAPWPELTVSPEKLISLSMKLQNITIDDCKCLLEVRLVF